MEDEVIQVSIGRRRIGLVGLKRIFQKVQSLGIEDSEKLEKKLLSLSRERNYIPLAAEKEYVRALLREYRRFTGQPFEEEGFLPEILVLGPGCVNCDELFRRVLRVACEMGLAADVRHVKDSHEILKYGVVPTPALVVNGSIKSAGKLLPVEKIRELLKETF